jgi:dTMP kinase
MASINDLATAASAVQALAPGAGSQSISDNTSAPGESEAAGAMSETFGTEHGVEGSDTGKDNVVRGALVVLEGLDRSGKTTQVKLLEQRFVELGRKVKVMRFPGTWFFPPILHLSQRSGEKCILTVWTQIGPRRLGK